MNLTVAERTLYATSLDLLRGVSPEPQKWAKDRDLGNHSSCRFFDPGRKSNPRARLRRKNDLALTLLQRTPACGSRTARLHRHEQPGPAALMVTSIESTDNGPGALSVIRAKGCKRACPSRKSLLRCE
jgi:hypothetical protein